MSKALELLRELADEKYAAFSAKLTPGIDPELFIGVRIPTARKLAKEYFKDEDSKAFLKELPHKYYDENILHGLLLDQIKDLDECVEALEAFLPYVNNWAVCDIMSPKVFKKKKMEALPHFIMWTKSPELYTSRFGIEMIMTHFLDEDFKPEFLRLVAGVKTEEYYLQMMEAWFFATALAKQWDATIPYVEERRLSRWIHNKTIQKGVESYRITPEQKDYLRSLRWK